MKKILLLGLISYSIAQKIIIPMDQTQNDHLKAYGIAYFTLTKNTNIEWLLNYRGGSFLIDNHQFVPSDRAHHIDKFKFYKDGELKILEHSPKYGKSEQRTRFTL